MSKQDKAEIGASCKIGKQVVRGSDVGILVYAKFWRHGMYKSHEWVVNLADKNHGAKRQVRCDLIAPGKAWKKDVSATARCNGEPYTREIEIGLSPETAEFRDGQDVVMMSGGSRGVRSTIFGQRLEVGGDS